MFSTGKSSEDPGEQQDFILRVIRQIIQALADIAKLRSSGKPEQALVEVHDACRSLLGIDPELVRLLGSEALIRMSEDQGWLEPLAKLLAEEALIRDLLGQTTLAESLREKSRVLLAAVKA